ncbi:MAG: phosphatase PAP2 family protein [Actinomadura sp.]
MLGGILVGVLGAPLVFLLVTVLYGRHGRTVPQDTAIGRLREARAQAVATLGPLGGFVLFLGAGVFLTAGVNIALGEALARLEDPVDWPTFHWVERIQQQDWAQLMNTIGQMGNIPESRVVGVVAAIALMFVAPSRRWVPPLLIGTVIVVQKYAQAGVGKIVDRGHPPTTLGTFPSGGCSRAIAIFGVIVFLVLAYTGANRRLRGIGWGTVATLAFVEGYTRTYLNKHWVTDVLGGWIFGAMLLAAVVFAGRALLPHPAARPADTVETSA